MFLFVYFIINQTRISTNRQSVKQSNYVLWRGRSRGRVASWNRTWVISSLLPVAMWWLFRLCMRMMFWRRGTGTGTGTRTRTRTRIRIVTRVGTRVGTRARIRIRTGSRSGSGSGSRTTIRFITVIHSDIRRNSLTSQFCIIKFSHCTLHIIVCLIFHNCVSTSNVTIANLTNRSHVILQVLAIT